ncbi:MAG: DUF1513 domain-containing protein [Burkholderiaceae bacterium]
MLMAGGLALMPAARANSANATLVAAWQDRDDQHIGLLSVGETAWSVQRSLKVPTRAHGLFSEPDGHVLAVARRPGDWLLRWHPASGKTQWHWIDGDRRFNGHVITSQDAQSLWTTETDLDTAQGVIGVRDVRTLEKAGEWPTHGMDPHQLLALPQAAGEFPAGTLMVANGGIPTLPETGRSKRHIDRMDASLVALHPATGALLGQWRLADPYLSIRHLAWNTTSRTLGIALQSEHPEPAMQDAAPVLATWDGRGLRATSGQPPMAGYGGDICALPDGGFGVSCPRKGRVALFDTNGTWRHDLHHPEACALTAESGQWWLASSRAAAGLRQGTATRPDAATTSAAPKPMADALIDNHWVSYHG